MTIVFDFIAVYFYFFVGRAQFFVFYTLLMTRYGEYNTRELQILTILNEK